MAVTASVSNEPPLNEIARERESQQIISALGRVFKRRKLALVASMVGVLAPVVAYNQMTPPLYEAASSVVFEEVGSGIGGEVSSHSNADLLLFNRIEEIKSIAFSDDVARALPQEIKERFPQPRIPRGDLTQNVSAVVHKSMTATPLRNSNIVRIRVQMGDPFLCQTVANLCLDVLQQRSYRIRHEGVADLRKFIEDQLVRFRGQLQQAEHNLMQFKQANSITSLDNESTEMLRRMTEAEVLLNRTRADRSGAEERRAAIQSALAAQRGSLVQEVTTVSTPSAQRLKDRLVDLQGQFAQLVVQEYPADHPQRLQLQQEIDQTKKALAEEALKVASGTTLGDPIARLEKNVEEAVALDIEIESMKAREIALAQTLGDYREFLAQLPSQEVALARLVLDRDVNAKIYTSLLERREEVRISEAKRLPTSRVIDRAQLPREPIRPRRKMNLMLGTIVGLIAGCGIGLLLESRSAKLGSTHDLEQETGWTVLAMIPALARGPRWREWLRRIWPERRGTEADRKMALVSHLDPESPAGGAYYMLRTRLELLGIGSKYRSVMITSSWPREGKSTTIANLAATFSSAGGSALVVDAELRRPVQHSIFGVEKAPGLSDLLVSRNGHGPHKEAADETPKPANGAFQATRVDGLTLLASGKRVREHQWETAKSRLGSLLEDLENKYDVVLVDSASPILVHDTLALCRMVDAVIVVVDAQSYDEERLAETKRLLEQAGANIIGAVVNKVDPGGRYSYYYYHYY
jgi:tyrosine-protein kinase Etk/Wzc